MNKKRSLNLTGTRTQTVMSTRSSTARGLCADGKEVSVSNDKSIIAKVTTMSIDQSQRKHWSRNVNLRTISFVWYTTNEIRFHDRTDKVSGMTIILRIDNAMFHRKWCAREMCDGELTVDVVWQIIQHPTHIKMNVLNTVQDIAYCCMQKVLIRLDQWRMMRNHLRNEPICGLLPLQLWDFDSIDDGMHIQRCNDDCANAILSMLLSNMTRNQQAT